MSNTLGFCLSFSEESLLKVLSPDSVPLLRLLLRTLRSRPRTKQAMQRATPTQITTGTTGDEEGAPGLWGLVLPVLEVAALRRFSAMSIGVKWRKTVGEDAPSALDEVTVKKNSRPGGKFRREKVG